MSRKSDCRASVALLNERAMRSDSASAQTLRETADHWLMLADLEAEGASPTRWPPPGERAPQGVYGGES